ncbi:MAG: terminase [Desulfobacterales bacterium]|nr:terminase [Desulfobacterales bacterium]
MAQAEKQKHPLEFLAENYFDDPLGFVMDCFPWGSGSLADEEGPDQWQTDVLEELGHGSLNMNEATQIARTSGHGIGKTAAIAWIVLWAISTRPHPQIVVTANTADQLSTKTWREIAKWHKLFEFGDLFKWTATKFFLKEHPETWFASAIPWSEHRAEAFAGTHERHVLLIFDEASNIADPIWEVAEGAMTTPGAMWVVFGNPTRNKGRFRECFGKFRHRWSTAKIDSRTAKMTDKTKLQQWVDDYGEDSDFVKVRVRGEFPSASSAQLISEDLIDDAMAADIHSIDYNHAPIIISVDVARYGDDQSVIMIRQGNKVHSVRKFREIDNMQLAGYIAESANHWRPQVIFVEVAGLSGTGVVDRLRHMGFSNVMEVVPGSAASEDKRFHNLRAEMWFRLRDWLKEGADIPGDPELRDDLLIQEYKHDNKDRLQLLSKEEIKLDGGASPDAGDALAIGFAVPVPAPEIATINQTRQRFAKRNVREI